jgi:hypothetical protein
VIGGASGFAGVELRDLRMSVLQSGKNGRTLEAILVPGYSTISVLKVAAVEKSGSHRVQSSRNSYRDPGKISQRLLCGYGERLAIVVSF